MEPIAIIGLGCRFPKSGSPEEFWRVLHEGVDCISHVPPGRWKQVNFDDYPALRGRDGLWQGGFLDQIDRFDPHFFHISPREAVRMDPQQRLTLEVVWEALEDAGQPKERLAGTRTGVFLGVMNSDYAHLNLHDISLIDTYLGAGSSNAIIASRVSYFLDLQGPSLVVDTLCSSSLVAVHLACQSLWTGDSTPLAVAGGVNVILLPGMSAFYAQSGLASIGGRCRTFDARADGIVRGEGAGVVILKLLSGAIRDGDQIYSVIRGSAVNHNGRSNGLTAPSRWAQIAVLREAYERAGVSPGEVQYVEAHGTGTTLGDPIEAMALGTVLAIDRLPDNKCAIGSVKTNMGHLESAAGIASLIKTVLMLKHRELPPSLHFENPNSNIPFDQLPLSVQQTLKPWPQTLKSAVAGVSSFGLGGTNVHVVIEESPLSIAAEPRGNGLTAQAAQLFTLSADSEEALKSLVRALRHSPLLDGHGSPASLEDLCFTGSIRRSHHDYRLALVAHSREELSEHLEAYLRGETRPGLSHGRKIPRRTPKLVFVFSGQGQQWRGMGRELLADEPIFRAAIEQCDVALRSYGGWSLLDELTQVPNDLEDSSRLDETEMAQPALFALQVALAALWLSWGIKPEAVVGHSMGEVAAAYVAGVLSLEDAVKIIFHRGRVMQPSKGRGKMIAVELSLEEAEEMLAGYPGLLSIAAHNGPRAMVLSGDPEALTDVRQTLEKRGIYCQLLPVDYAFHSPQMVAFQPDLERALTGINPRSSSIPIYSTATGGLLEGRLFGASYWAEQMSKRVRFAPPIQALLKDGPCHFIEIGAHPVLRVPIHQCLGREGKRGTVLPSLRRGEDERAIMRGSLGALYCLGHDIDWSNLYPGRRSWIRFPSYPWQRERFWWDAEEEATEKKQPTDHQSGFNHPLLGRHFSPAQAAGQHFWEARLELQSLPYLRDHQIQGVVVFPGTAYVEMAVAAGAAVFGTKQLLLTDVEFHKALFLPPDGARVLQTVLTRAQDADASFKIYSRADSTTSPPSWTLHATGKICRQQENAGLSEVVLSKYSGDGPPQFSGKDFYEALQEFGLDYGPAFQGITYLCPNDDGAMGRVSIPEQLTAELDRYQLHPAALDMCLQAGWSGLPHIFSKPDQACGNERGRSFMPVRIDEIHVYGRLGSRMWSHARRISEAQNANELVVNVEILDEVGRVLIEFRGVRARSIGTTKQGPRDSEADRLLYELQWEAKEFPDAQVTSAVLATARLKDWLIFADRDGVGEALATLLKEHGARTILVYPGKSFERVSEDVVRVAATQRHEIDKLINAFQMLAHGARWQVVHLWALDIKVTLASSVGALELAQMEGWASILYLTKTLAPAALPEAPGLWLITRGAQTISAGQTPAAVMQAPIWGLGRTLAGEHPSVWGGLVDLDPKSDAFDAATLLVRQLLSADGEDQTAFREGKRYVPRLLPRLEDTKQAPAINWRAEGSCLITGGQGDLGLAAARWMVEQGARHLILLGRTALPPRDAWPMVAATDPLATKIAAIRELEASGARIYPASCDVADEQQMLSFLEEFRRAGWPPIRGVLHAAGVFIDQPFIDVEVEGIMSVLRPKMIGAWLLHKLLGEAQLDFFVLFSSVSSILSSPNLAGYAAANAFLDALANNRRACRSPALSINWGVWGQIGMATRTDRKGPANRAMRSLTTVEALDALGRLLQQNSPQVLVMSIDWQRWKHHYPAASRAPILSRIAGLEQGVKAPTQAPTECQVLTRESLLSVSLEKRRAMLNVFLREHTAQILMLAPAQLDLQMPLNSLGLDSLMAIEIRNMIEVDLGVILPMALLLEDPSVAQLTNYLLDHLPASEASVAGILPKGSVPQPALRSDPLDAEDARYLLDTLDQLPDEVVDDLLSELISD